jgi:hypothetical protein
MFPQFGKILVIFGVILVLIGLVLVFFDKIPFLGKLPGDIIIKKDRFTVYFPIVTFLIISIILTIILNIFSRGK